MVMIYGISEKEFMIYDFFFLCYFFMFSNNVRFILKHKMDYVYNMDDGLMVALSVFDDEHFVSSETFITMLS